VTIVAHDIGPIGGMERQLTELIDGLLGDGYRLTVISRTCDVPPHERLTWVRVPAPGRPFALAYPWFFVLGSLLTRKRRCGVLHTTGAIVLNRSDVCTVHFCHRALGDLEGFSRASRGGIAYRLNEVVSKWMSDAAERLCFRPSRVDRLIGVSRGVARELREHFPRMRDRIGVIPNGVDMSMFWPASANGGGDRHFTAILVGSEWERKGLDLAIEALPEVPGARLLVVGEGDVERFGELARGLGVEDRVRFAGVTADVGARYREADVLVLPTAYETFSLVTYEAAACGLPLLVTKVNGVEDLLEDGKHGWFLERRAEDVAEKLRALQADPDKRRAMGSESHRASRAFGWRKVVESYEALYDDVAGAAA
jgi:UDP-glucose:(heptosyl)LPS alpha-1,3-glucosyltransferase